MGIKSRPLLPALSLTKGPKFNGFKGSYRKGRNRRWVFRICRTRKLDTRQEEGNWWILVEEKDQSFCTVILHKLRFWRADTATAAMANCWRGLEQDGLGLKGVWRQLCWHVGHAPRWEPDSEEKQALENRNIGVMALFLKKSEILLAFFLGGWAPLSGCWRRLVMTEVSSA